MSDIADFEKVKISLKVAEERSSQLKGQLKEVDSQITVILEELEVNTIEEAREKVKSLESKLVVAEKEILKEAGSLGLGV